MKINWQKTAAIAGVAGFALVLLTNQEAQAAIGGFFGEKSKRGSGTVGGGAFPPSPSTGTDTITKKDIAVASTTPTGATPTSFDQNQYLREWGSALSGERDRSIAATQAEHKKAGEAYQANPSKTTFSGAAIAAIGIPESKKSTYTIEASRTEAGFLSDVSKLKEMGATYIGMNAAGEFVFSQPVTKKEAATQPTETTVATSTGYAVYEGSKKVASTTNKSRTDSSGKATQKFTSRGWVGS